MSFSQSSISNLRTSRSGADLVVSWTSSAAAGTIHQVYLGCRLAWWGVETSVRFPWPQSLLRIDVGTVGASEGPTSFTGSLPAMSLDGAQCRLEWLAGTFLGADIAGFKVFASPSPGASVSYTTPVADLAAYPSATTDGWGLGGYDAGGWGASASTYSWTTDRLAPGTWTFDVRAYDAIGNLSSTSATQTLTIAAPPNPPAANARGIRLTYTFNVSTRVATLNWLASPA